MENWKIMFAKKNFGGIKRYFGSLYNTFWLANFGQIP